MYTCWNCGQQDRSGLAHCVECGAAIQVMVIKTVHISRAELKQLLQTLPLDTSPLSDDNLLVIEMPDEQLAISLKQKVLLGRKLPQQAHTTFVDLDPFGGYCAGVSRRHAELRRLASKQLILTDLSSANGTFVGGRKLIPHQPYRLHDGDQVFLGNLSFIVHYDEAACYEY